MEYLTDVNRGSQFRMDVTNLLRFIKLNNSSPSDVADDESHDVNSSAPSDGIPIPHYTADSAPTLHHPDPYNSIFNLNLSTYERFAWHHIQTIETLLFTIIIITNESPHLTVISRYGFKR